MKRRFFFLFFGVFLPIIVAYGQRLAVQDVVYERFAERDFDRLSQYFSDKKSEFRHFYHATSENHRAGLHGIVFLDRRPRNLPAGTILELQFYVAGDPEEHSVVVPLGCARIPSNELWIGLTDSRFCQLRPQDIAAWRITIRCSGSIICQKKSFLFPESGEE